MFDAGIISLSGVQLEQPFARVERPDVDGPDAALR